MNDTFEMLPLCKLHEPRISLRPVDKSSLDYLQLKSSLRTYGLLQSVIVEPSEKYPNEHDIVAGEWRRQAGLDVNIEKYPATVKYNLTDRDRLAIQLQENAISAKTRPLDYAKHLRRIMDTQVDGQMTLKELHAITNMSPFWLAQCLGLLYIRNKDIQDAINRSEISLKKAFLISKLPPIYQEEFFEYAKTTTLADFQPIVQAFIKQFKEDIKEGRMTKYYGDIEPHPFLRPLTEIQTEYLNITQIPLLLASNNCTDILEACRLSLQWCLNLDPSSLEQRQLKLNKKLKVHLLKKGE